MQSSEAKLWSMDDGQNVFQEVRHLSRRQVGSTLPPFVSGMLHFVRFSQVEALSSVPMHVLPLPRMEDAFLRHTTPP